jgi:dihydrodipicolinate synthase/N-acetylneuraminate lyase
MGEIVMSLQALIEKFKQAREKATIGTWVQNNPERNAPGVVSTIVTKDYPGHVADCFASKDGEFITLSANEILKLIEACEVMQNRLKWIAQEPDENVDVLEAIYIVEAKNALSKSDEICKGVTNE